MANINYPIGNDTEVKQNKTDILSKVDKVAGKGLSTEDYTTAEKSKVANLPADTNASLAENKNRIDEIITTPVKPSNTTFITTGKNLFNKNTRTDGYFINSAGGLGVDVARSVSDFIDVIGGLNYCFTRIKLQNAYAYLAWYDSAKVKISSTYTVINPVIAPATAKYCRITMLTVDKDVVQVEQSDTPTAYESFKYKYSNIKIESSELDNESITAGKIPNKVIPFEKTNFIKTGKNLFNKDAITSNKFVDISTGLEITSVGYTLSDYIPVTGGLYYTRTANAGTTIRCWYDSEKKYISGTGGISAEGWTEQAPENACYLKFNCYQGAGSISYTLVQLEEGQIATDLEAYKTEFNLANLIIPEVNIKKSYLGKSYMFLGDSITYDDLAGWNSSWTRIVQEKLKPSSYVNVAVVGARWKDDADTVYDGNPSYSLNNVIGNQVQKILNNAYESPDVIVIACGTNDANEIVTDDQIAAQFYDNGAFVPLASADRKTFAGAMRYAVETLRTLYPNAQIFLTTPVQRADTVDSYPIIQNKGSIIKRCGHRLSVPVFDTAECGIYGLTGAWQVSQGDFTDGLHLSEVGSDKLGKYICRKLIDWFQV